MNLSHQIKGDVWFLNEINQEPELIAQNSFLFRLFNKIEANKKSVDVASYITELAKRMKNMEQNISFIYIFEFIYRPFERRC